MRLAIMGVGHSWQRRGHAIAPQRGIGIGLAPRALQWPRLARAVVHSWPRRARAAGFSWQRRGHAITPQRGLGLGLARLAYKSLDLVRTQDATLLRRPGGKARPTGPLDALERRAVVRVVGPLDYFSWRFAVPLGP